MGSASASVLEILRNADAPVRVRTLFLLGEGTRPRSGRFGQKTLATSMHEKTKQEQQQLSRERPDRDKSVSPKSSADLPSIYDDGFARRAGEIIARAVAAVHRRGKRR